MTLTKQLDVNFIDPNFIFEDRLDAHYYSNKFHEVEKKIKLAPYAVKKFSEIAKKIKCGPFGSSVLAENYDETGIIMVRPLNLKNVLLSNENLVRFPEKALGSNFPTFKHDDLLFARVGMPSCSIIPKTFESVTISPNIIAAELIDNIDAYYIATFMNTPFGLLQIERRFKAVSQPTVSTEELKTLDIFLPDFKYQKYIGDKVRKAEQLREEINRVVKEVESLFYNYTLLKEKTDDTKDATKEFGVFVEPKNILNLLGPEVYKSDYVENQNMITALNNYVNFEECYEYIVNGVDSRNYINDIGTPYYKVAAIDMYGIKEASVDYVDVFIDSINTKQKIEDGDLLITRKGSFGISMGVQARDMVGIISSEVFKVRLKNGWDADYLAYFLNSNYGQKQFLQFATGSTMKGISQQNIVEILIPKIEYYKQQEIGFLVRSIKDMYYQSRELIQQAKNDVESLIEGTFDEAIVKKTE